MALLAIITKQEVIERILSHLNLPPCPVHHDRDDAVTYYDVTGEPVPEWAAGMDPAPHERGPPDHDDVIDPPSPNE